jgi:hypothetical protein
MECISSFISIYIILAVISLASLLDLRELSQANISGERVVALRALEETTS